MSYSANGSDGVNPSSDFLFVEHFVYLLFEKGQIVFDYRPDYTRVNAEIVMDKNISHPDDFRQSDLGMFLHKFLQKSADGFADNLQMMQRLSLNQLALFKRCLPACGIFLDSLNRFPNVQ